MAAALSKKFTLNDLRLARTSGEKVPVLTCYDFTTAKLMQAAGVPVLLVGDSAANVVLGHETTLPVSLEFMIEITAAVRRGAPLVMLMGDLPFGSYGGDSSRGDSSRGDSSRGDSSRGTSSLGFDSATRMVKLSGCDCVKIEVGTNHANLVTDCADAGIAIVAHLGLKPQSVSLMGGYRFQGRTASEAKSLISLAVQMEKAGAAAILLEAVPPEVAQKVVEHTTVPIIGCGAGPACHGSVVVTPDALGMFGGQNAKPPRFVPQLANIADSLSAAFARYVNQVRTREYPAAEHQYEMQPEERRRLLE